MNITSLIRAGFGYEFEADATCDCGSGEYPRAISDARGIYVCRACHVCEDRKLAGYRPEIFTNPQYAADERIEDDF